MDICKLLASARTGLAAGLILIAPHAFAQSVAFTFDDGPHWADDPRFTAIARNQAMLDALRKNGVQAALMVTLGNGAYRPEGYALAKAWGDAGHVIGNHTVTHPDLNSPKVTLEHYQKELLDCDNVIRTLPGYRKWFRFTFLREGNTPEKRDGMRTFLKAQGYRNAYVSLDTSDWRFNAKLNEVLTANPKADIEPIRRAYLAHMAQRAEAYRALSQKLLGRELPQVMLLHHNLVSALWLDDLIGQFKANGWTIVSPETAFADPVYQTPPEQSVTGQSLLLSIARSRGLGKFAGWDRLVDDGDFEIAALAKLGL